MSKLRTFLSIPFVRKPWIIARFMALSLIRLKTSVLLPFRRLSYGKRRIKASLYRLEHLDRGLVAMKVEGGIYLSWRMFFHEDQVFGSSTSSPVFHLLRDGVEIAVLEGITNYLDTSGTMESSYSLLSSDGSLCTPVKSFESGKNWFDIPLERPSESPEGPYLISDVCTGDLDGDGEYELVVKWESGAKDNSQPGRTGQVLLDAYKLDGRRLWKRPIDLGLNIRAGAHYTQVLVYDFDRDSRSEIILKTAPGSKDSEDRFVSLASRIREIVDCDNFADLRDESGVIMSGDEFLTVFDGLSGSAMDTIYYPNQRIAPSIWGDDYGNRSERYTAAVAWLDGKKPYGVFMRGYNFGRKDPLCARQCACAVTVEEGKLNCRHSFDTYKEFAYPDKSGSSSFFADGRYKGVSGYRLGNEIFIGEGNHNCSVADVDGDFKDEVLTGALCYGLVGDRLSVKWCTFRGHGDALHLFPVGRGRYEFLTAHETGGRHPVTKRQLDRGLSVLSAATGRTIFHAGSEEDMGRVMMADLGAGGEYQFWGRYGPAYRRIKGGFEEIQIPGKNENFRVYWDGSLNDNLLDGHSGCPLEVSSWNGTEMEKIFVTEGCTSINGTKAVPCLQADILGDWREELVMARADHEALRVFVSCVPTRHSMMTLMHDPVYRAGVAAEQTGYNQPPHVGFILNWTEK